MATLGCYRCRSLDTGGSEGGVLDLFLFSASISSDLISSDSYYPLSRERDLE